MTTQGLKLAGITKTWPGSSRPVLDDIDLEIGQGQTVHLLGQNGSGKTTLLNIIAGHVRCDRGVLEFDGQRLEALSARERARRIASVPQNPSRGLLDDLSILENLLLAAEPAGQPMPWLFPKWRARKSVQDRIHDWALGLAGRLDDDVRLLSGGERQLLAIMAVALRTPQVFLLDEPTSALDARIAAQVDGVVREIRERSRPAAIIVTHRLAEALERADRIVVLREGRIVADLDRGDPNWSMEWLTGALWTGSV